MTHHTVTACNCRGYAGGGDGVKEGGDGCGDGGSDDANTCGDVDGDDGGGDCDRGNGNDVDVMAILTNSTVTPKLTAACAFTFTHSPFDVAAGAPARAPLSSAFRILVGG